MNINCYKVVFIKSSLLVPPKRTFNRLSARDVEAEAGSGSGGSGTFSVEAEADARKIHRFRIGGKNGERKKLVLLPFVKERMEGA